MEGIKLKKYSREISQSFNDIDKLVEVPSLIQKMALDGLKNFDTSCLKNTDKVKLNNLIKSIENISDRSINESFKIIYNQVCVLAVSALSATLEKYFINFIVAHWNKMDFSKEETKISLAELSEYNFNIKPVLGRIILKKISSINFQDLQSTVRSFNKYCKKTLVLDPEVEKIVLFYQQCRHVLVHKNGYVDEEFIKKVGNNNIKNYKIGDAIKLEKLDWENIKNNFSRLVGAITSQKSAYDLHPANQSEG